MAIWHVAPLRFAPAFRALGVCEHIWLRYKNFDPSCFDPIKKFGIIDLRTNSDFRSRSFDLFPPTRFSLGTTFSQAEPNFFLSWLDFFVCLSCWGHMMNKGSMTTIQFWWFLFSQFGWMSSHRKTVVKSSVLHHHLLPPCPSWLRLAGRPWILEHQKTLLRASTSDSRRAFSISRTALSQVFLGLPGGFFR